MKIDYSEYEWNEGLCGKISIPNENFNKKINVEIHEDDNAEVRDESKRLFEFFLDNYAKYKEIAIKEILDYYDSYRMNLGTIEPDDPDYPEANDIDTISKMISLKTIIIHNPDLYDKDAIGLIYDCTWDKDDGIGINLSGFDVASIGTHDCAY